MSTYNVHGGHAAFGAKYCGAVGLLDESKEDRLIANQIISLLQAEGHTVYNCTVDSGTSQTNVLSQICTKCNAHSVDYDISIHLNSGRSDSTGDGKVGGFEIWVTDTSKGKGDIATRIRSKMKSLGFSDRGTKTTSDLYFLNHTNAPALLLEICFVDDKDDYDLYNKVGYKKIAEEIVKGILNKPSIFVPAGSWIRDTKGWWYKHADGSYTKSDWEKINGYWYYFDASGYMLTGWQKVKNVWYYLKDNGAMQTGWLQDNGKWYYLKDSGAMAKNEILTIDSKQYVFLPDGHMGRTNINGVLS